MLQKETVSKELLDTLVNLQTNTLFEEYILAGGTALALQLGHRKSDDIDLFTFKDINNYEIYHTEENILQTTINNIKVDFISTPVNLIEKPIEKEDIKLSMLAVILLMLKKR